MTSFQSIRFVVGSDHKPWLSLWEGYQKFYEMTVPDGVTNTTWSRMLDASEPVFAALAIDEAGVAVGLVHWLYHLSTSAESRYCYLQDLFTAPASRGRGVGGALIEFVRRQAASDGCSRVYWLTHETNSVARRLYDKVSTRTGFIQYRLNT